MLLWTTRCFGEPKSCGTVANSTNRMAPSLFNARNFQDVIKPLPDSMRLKTILGKEDRIPFTKGSVTLSFTILQKTCVVLPLCFADVDCLVASAHSRRMLLSCVFDWGCWSIHDHLWCCLCRSIHFATPYGLYFSWRNTIP